LRVERKIAKVELTKPFLLTIDSISSSGLCHLFFTREVVELTEEKL